MASDKSDDSPDALLGDLESIRTLLDEQSAGDSTDSAPIDDQVPLLEDVVVHSATASPDSGGDAAGGGMDDALFDALLDDNWKETAAELLDQTRSTIAEHGGQWTQQDTQALNEALQARLDATLTQWLRSVVQNNVADLRAQLLQVTQAELATSVTRLLNDDSENQPAGSPDTKNG